MLLTSVGNFRLTATLPVLISQSGPAELLRFKFYSFSLRSLRGERKIVDCGQAAALIFTGDN